MTQVRATIARQAFTLDPVEVAERLRAVLPDPIDDHFAVVGGRRFPPKQVLAVATGLDRADFNTHQARRVLSRLGFTVGRRSMPALVAAVDQRSPRTGGEAEALRPFVGQWVAQLGLEVLVAADDPLAVLSWLERHNRHADAMFRVPVDSGEATGLAPM